jgi:hypothetical protein
MACKKKRRGFALVRPGGKRRKLTLQKPAFRTGREPDRGPKLDSGRTGRKNIMRQIAEF